MLQTDDDRRNSVTIARQSVRSAKNAPFLCVNNNFGGYTETACLGIYNYNVTNISWKRNKKCTHTTAN